MKRWTTYTVDTQPSAHRDNNIIDSPSTAMVHPEQHNYHRIILLPIVAALAFLLVIPLQSTAHRQDINLRQTVQALQDIKGTTAQDLNRYQTILENFTFIEKKTFQALCKLPGLQRDQLDKLVSLVQRYPIRYSHMNLLDQYVLLQDSSLDKSEELLGRLANPTFVQERAVAALGKTRLRSCRTVLAVVDILKQLDETGLWCARQLFESGHGDDQLALDSLHQISRMDDPQQRAAEKFFQSGTTSPDSIPVLLGAILQLSESAAYNAESLFMERDLDGATAESWLTMLFMPAGEAREEAVNGLSSQEKQALLHIYNRAASKICWRINSLHAITNTEGYEIGNYRLNNMGTNGLTTLFMRLHESARHEHNEAFHRALDSGHKQEAIAVLNRATSFARQATALELTTGNIYLLLANGGELYDSSFRDVLVPAFREKLASHFRADLLYFLRQTDPAGEFTADLITNLAQKGKLTDVLPPASEAQQQLIELVAASALQGDNSLLLFSATFPKLLHDLHPAARARLLAHLCRAAGASTTLGLQVRTILQYYYDHQPKLLTSEEKVAIRQIFDQHGRVNLTPYTTTPFHEWLADGRLRSLSSFATDDDGRASYISFSRQLLDRGYRPFLADDYPLTSSGVTTKQELTTIIGAIPVEPTRNISELFGFGGTTPFVVDWRKKLHGIEIIHSTSIYSDQTAQERLLELFFMSGAEMFAQRGHSYYRKTHLLTPLMMLYQKKRIDDATIEGKQRFISLGSCGGIQAYSQLTNLLHNRVDIFGSIGTGRTVINNPYNQKLLELAATEPSTRSWETVHRRISAQFDGADQDYIYPGSLPAILHKMQEIPTTK